MNSKNFKAAHPVCCWPGCSAPTEVADHYPRSRRELVEMGDPHPDAWDKLRPLCSPHDRVQTAQRQPGGWHANKRAIEREAGQAFQVADPAGTLPIVGDG